MTTTTTTTGPGAFSRSVDAVERTRAGASLWDIADALLAEVGPGESRSRFELVRRACHEAGVEPYSVSALRQYRDVAAHWPSNSRLPGVSFSAHRAALPAKDPESLLRGLVATHGNKVTVKTVAEAASVDVHGAVAVAGKRKGAEILTEASAGSLFEEVTRRLRSAGWDRQRNGDRKAPDLVPDVIVADLSASGLVPETLKSLRVLVSALEASTKTKETRSAMWSGPAAKRETKTNETTTNETPARRRGLR